MAKSLPSARAQSGHQQCCPVLATVHQLLMHREAFCQFNKPHKGSTKAVLYYLPSGANIALCGLLFTKCIRNKVTGVQSITGVNPSE